MAIHQESNSSSGSERVAGAEVKAADRKISSYSPTPFKFEVPASVQMNPPKQSGGKSVKPISVGFQEQIRFEANQSWIKKMQDTAQWEWDHLYMEWDLRDLLNIPKLARLND